MNAFRSVASHATLPRFLLVIAISMAAAFVTVGAPPAQAQDTGLPNTQAPGPARQETVEYLNEPTPVLQIPIPDLSFGRITVREVGQNRYIDVPWLAQYIAAIFRYSFFVAGLMASVMFIIGGFQYLTSGGSDRAAKGKKRITDALTGLVLLISTYAILNIINPDLIALRALSDIRTPERKQFSSQEEEDYGDTAVLPGTNTHIGPSQRVCDSVESCRTLCAKPQSEWPTHTPGMLDPSQAVEIPTVNGLMGMGNKASQATVDGLKRAAAIAYQEGYVIRVTSGYRPLSRQIANVCTKIKNNDTSIGGSIAWPGGSNHGIGVAVDAELLRNGKVLVSSADLPEGSSCQRQAAGTLAKPEDTRTFDRIMTQAGAVRYTNEMWHYEFNSPITSCRCKYPDCPAPPRTCTHKPC